MQDLRAPVIALLSLSLLGVAGTGCHHDEVYLTVRSPADMNEGRPIRMLVRAVDEQEYVNESYQAVSDKVVIRDDSVLHQAVVYPNVPLAAKIKWPSSKGIGVYFFFTEPGPRWRGKLEMPLPHATTIVLGRNNIRTIEQK
jgi:hypothetical protein